MIIYSYRILIDGISVVMNAIIICQILIQDFLEKL